VRAEYVWGSLGPVARIAGGRVQLYVCDALGHVRALIDAETGQITDRYDYDAWGNVVHNGTTRQPFTWNGAYGYEWVPETGLYHVGARAYDPRTARWLQRDPIDAASGDPNLYRYAGNDPVNFFDGGSERQAKDDNNKSAGEEARQKELEKLCKKWMKDMEERIKEMIDTLKHYKPVKDQRGGYWSHRKQGYTVPGGHRQKIQDLSNSIKNLRNKLNRCKKLYPERVEQLQEEANNILQRANEALNQFASATQPAGLPQTSCNRSPVLEGAKEGAAAAGTLVILYWIISEGSRLLFPPRNLVPVP
jgi:RHS repeat-associated protein